jgi:hypothetical protein
MLPPTCIRRACRLRRIVTVWGMAAALGSFGCGDGGSKPAPNPGKDAGSSGRAWEGGIGPVLSFAGPVLSAATVATSVAAGDLDRDGAPDLVLGGAVSGLDVLLNTGSGTFSRAVGYRSQAPVPVVALADVDGNGSLDVVSVTLESGRGMVEIRRNDGRGVLSPATAFDSGGGTINQLAVGDLDGDSRPDVVVRTPGRIALLGNVGDGSLQAPVVLAAGITAEAVAIGDFNHDGRLDLALATIWPDAVAILLNDGSATFAAPSMFPLNERVGAVATGDADGDGRTDLFMAGFTGSVSVLLNRGDGSFGAPHDIETTQPMLAFAVADLDGDGNTDVAGGNAGVGGDGIGRVTVMRGRGDGSFDAPVSYHLRTGAVAIANVAGDARPDIVAVGRDGTFVLTNRSH